MFRSFTSVDSEKTKIDAKDRKILILLSENARMPVSEIAKKVQLSRDAVAYRIKRLQSDDVIVAFYPNLDFSKLGLSNYHVFLLVDEKDKEKLDELITSLKAHPNTVDLIEYSDEWDFEWILLAEDIVTFDAVVSEALAKYSSVIIEKSKFAVITKYYSTVLPDTIYKKPAKTAKSASENSSNVDKKDLKIICALADDCRISTYEISKKVDLSPDAVGLRLKRLVSSGVIKQFTILPNVSALNYNMYTLAIKLSSMDRSQESKFQELLNQDPNILKAVKTLGAWDMLIYVVAENASEFHKTAKRIRSEFSSIIKAHSTFVAYKEHVFRGVPKMLEKWAEE